MTRKCGPCHVCCTVLGIHEIGKAPGERCWRLGEKGCTIYAKRPTSCSAWSCMWLQGRFASNERPDKAGVLITQVPETLPFARATGLVLFNALQTSPGELSPVGQGLFDKIARANLITLGAKVYGPQEKVDRLAAWQVAELAKRDGGSRPKGM